MHTPLVYQPSMSWHSSTTIKCAHHLGYESSLHVMQAVKPDEVSMSSGAAILLFQAWSVFR